MIDLNALRNASTVLQNIADTNTATALPSRQATNPIAEISLHGETSDAAARKSVSSHIFNAVADLSERDDKLMEKVIDYIDRKYTRIEEIFANTIAAIGDDPSFMNALAKHKEVGERLKEQALADPVNTLKLLDRIQKQRPDISLDDAMAFLMVEFGKIYARNNAAASQ